MLNSIPNAYYGVLEQNYSAIVRENAAEQTSNLGFAVHDGGYDASELKAISEDLPRVAQHCRRGLLMSGSKAKKHRPLVDAGARHGG